VRTGILLAAAVVVTTLGVGLGFHLGQRTVTATAQPGPVDVGFSQDMSTHHAQAILMADIVAPNPDPAVTAVAARIKVAQLEEVGRMQGFLGVWERPALPVDPPMAWMGPATPGHSMRDMSTPGGPGVDSGMPGLATRDQLGRLRTLTGEDQAVLFLRLMLRHHEGGIEMSDYAARYAGMPVVRALAGRMSFDQQQEDQVLRQLLLARGSDPRLPPG
jgi:uncharacterized protein (DUF305 family)